MASTDIKTEREEAEPRNEDAAAREGRHGQRPRYKSFRKKYRKMRTSFEGAMEEANNVFLAEHKAWEIARRIQEQNDEILDVLLDLSQMPGSPSATRYDLDAVNGDAKSGETALSALEQKTTYTPYNLVQPAALPKDLVDLDRTVLQNYDMPTQPPAYFTPADEEEYLSNLDAHLASIPSMDNLHPSIETIQLPYRRPSKPTPTERDFALHNSVSVHNFLRRHHPGMFEVAAVKDGKDKDSEKGDGEKAGKSKAKKDRVRGIGGLQFNAFNDGNEEEVGFDSALEASTQEGGGSARARKKRDGDQSYRPKGGHRSIKRKRGKGKDDGESEEKTPKKARKISSMMAADELDDEAA